MTTQEGNTTVKTHRAITTFLNVTISLAAKNPKAAYTKLCAILATGDPDIAWTTDTYIVGDEWHDQGRSTERLFPKSTRRTKRGPAA